MNVETSSPAPGLSSSLLSTPYSSVTRDALSRHLWGAASEPQSLNRIAVSLEQFWVYYSRECSNGLQDGGRHVMARSHWDIIDITSKLKQGMLRGTLTEHLRTKLAASHVNEDEILANTVDLAASLLLMTGFGNYSYGFSGRTQLNWNQKTLKEFMHEYFGEEPSLSSENVKLERVFTARNLNRIGGLEIAWTDNLVDHLRLTDDDKRVLIFHHASFLERQRQSDECLFPDGLMDETLRTLALLFPSTDLDTRKWFDALPLAPNIDKRVLQCGRLKTDHRRIDKFRFWKDRMITLKQAFDEAQPKSLSQWWHDRRNGVQWYTFWVAVMVLGLTILFGLIQSIEGALQVYATFHSLGSQN